MVTGWVISGRAEAGEIVLPLGRLKVIVLAPLIAFAAVIADRSVTVPGGGLSVSAVLFTTKEASSLRDSRPSTDGRRRRRRGRGCFGMMQSSVRMETADSRPPRGPSMRAGRQGRRTPMSGGNESTRARTTARN